MRRARPRTPSPTCSIHPRTPRTSSGSPSACNRFAPPTPSTTRRLSMPGRNFLFVPGPTNVPDRILRSMMVAMEDHRSPRFPELSRGLFPQLKRLFQCHEGEVFIFPATGTGAWEASLANTLSPGDRVLAPRFGQFSHLWIDMMQRLGLEVDVIDCEWGTGAPEERIAAALRADS